MGTATNNTKNTSVQALPGLWREECGLGGLVRLDTHAQTPGMVVVAKAGEPWQTHAELRWQAWPDLLHPEAGDVSGI